MIGAEDNSECGRRKAGRPRPEAREKEDSERLSSQRRWESPLLARAAEVPLLGLRFPCFLPRPGSHETKRSRMPLAHTSSPLQRPSQRQLRALPFVPCVPPFSPPGTRSEVRSVVDGEKQAAGLAAHLSAAVLSRAFTCPFYVCGVQAVPVFLMPLESLRV